ncbi:MAG: glycosyltransferase family 2 protein [Patescibacteria group bacterium]|nr:glycosyltransferase family 2 protein [Patescibacteria group bacterium]
MKLTVHLVAWNGAKYIPYLFDSLRKQSLRDWFLLIIDNNSQDGTAELIKKELVGSAERPFEYRLEENKENSGFAAGHNRAFRETDSEYFLLLNQDMYLAADCLEKTVKFLDEHPETASVSPRLMKWNFAEIQNNGLEKSFSNQIDALGLKVFRNRRVIEQFTGQDWNNVSEEEPIEVFGVSGAFPMYRRSIIKNVLFDNGQFLDESYHSYKEDVDLAYRLAVAGFKSYVLPNIVAYHDRSAAGPKEQNDASAIANKKKQSELVKYHSYKNHLMTLYKNEYWQNFVLDFPWIFWYELKKAIYFLLFDRKTFFGLKEILQNKKDLREKRIKIKNTRKIGWIKIRKWWA